MALSRPKNQQGAWFEQPTDPALVATNGVDSLSKWIDNSTVPSIVKERNSTNTAWNSLAPLGRFTDSIASATAGQTTLTLTHTPISLQDISWKVNGWSQDNVDLVSLVGNILTFPALTLGWSADFNYTRLN